MSAIPTSDEGEDLWIVRGQELQFAATKGPVALAQGEQPLHPPEQRVRIVLLHLDVDRLEKNRIVAASGKSFRANLPVEPVEMESIRGQTVISPVHSIDPLSTAFTSTIT